ncbi:hypothetical protein ABVT39_023722 [Epinephelus coioides]
MSSVIMSQHPGTNRCISLHQNKTIKQTKSLILRGDTNKSDSQEHSSVSARGGYSLAAVYQLGQLTSAVNRRRKPAAINNKPQHPPTSTCNASDR